MKLLLILIVAINLFVYGIQSVSIVDNVTVSSDVLSEVFIKEIKNNPNKIYIIGDGGGEDIEPYDSKKCLLSLREIINKFPDRQVSRFLDAWGNLPSGIESGNEYDMGNYDQCVKTSVKLSGLSEEVNGQYCFATILLHTDQPPNHEIHWWNLDPSLSTGICAPDSCSPQLLTSIFKEAVSGQFEGVLSRIMVGRCSNGKIPPLTTLNIIGLSIFGLVTILMVLSSSYEFYTSFYEKKPIPILMTFSVLTNGKRLFAINTKKSRNNIDCLTGIRVLSTFWIINHHTYTNIHGTPIINNRDHIDWLYSPEFFPALNASISVDTFLFMGGLLVAWIGFRELDKSSGKISPLMNIVHRYFRLTPILGAGLLMAYSVNKVIYTGPIKSVQMEKNSCDGTNWWPVMLYIQNYYFQEKRCYEEAWYLAIDFQLYALSPLLLVPMWKWGKKFAPVLLILGLSSIGCVIGIYLFQGYVGLMLGLNPHEWERVYTPTHTRCSTWLLGFGFGYFLHKNRQSNFKIPKIVQLIGWVVSFLTMTAVVFGPYFSLSANGQGTVFEAAMYEGFKRISWGLAHVWITFACYYGYGGFVDTFLSHPFWQPFGRLTYAMYMMHMAVERMHFGLTRTEIYFSVYNQFLYFWSAFGITFLISIYVTLAFESPILILEKFIFPARTPAAVPKTNPEQTMVVSPSVIVDPEQAQKQL
ncbi:nose resistant to fluoxetine protein 6-like [Eupeodes corollae]|uniref:nose resistant to fluoxetine protein 6-like n=1 Tax=Eupeodes corollae TaxID=290404 RepID=UPI002491C021|nr:nose resistant to fluoxetine protein 6-like [Eupeodes corollae]